MHGRLDTSLPELSEWIVLASAEGKSPSLAWEKELAHSPSQAARVRAGSRSTAAAEGLGLMP